jgi:type IV pilus assembly protein PilY1
MFYPLPLNDRSLRSSLVLVFSAVVCSSSAWSAPPNTSTAIEAVPPNVGMTGNNKPMMMLVTSKDQTLFGPIYTDFEDLDGDGTLDVTFKPTFKYYGYFDATKCYTYNTSANSGQFEPHSTSTVTDGRYTCGGSGQWSGNFLNWATMSRVDVIRKMLYGGERYIDSSTTTVLQLARTTRGSHSFVKYYDGDDINDYTPFSKAALTKTTGSNANVYAGLTMCMTSSADGNGSSAIQQIRMTKGNYRLWSVIETTVCHYRDDGYSEKFEFGTKARDYYKDSNLGGGKYFHEERIPNRTTDGATYSSIGPVLNGRIKVCDSSKLGAENCQTYTNSSGTSVMKPVGLLQTFGTPHLSGLTSARAEFGLITGSYDKNLTAGVLRKNMLDLTDEVNPSTGQFCFNDGAGNTISCSGTRPDGRSYTGAGIIKSLNSILLYGRGSPNYTGSSSTLPQSLTNGTFPAWGNPVGEMVVQALQYFAGLSSTNPTTTTNDASIGMPVATWTDPLSDTNTWRKSAYGKGMCRPMNLLAISSSAMSFDANDGDTEFEKLPNRSRGSLSAFTDAVGTGEGINGTSRSVGHISSGWGEECSAKSVGNLSAVTGICPVAPALGGSYKIAGAALYGNVNKIRTVTNPPSDLPDTALKVKTYAAAMAGGVPRVEVPIPNTSPQKFVYITPEALFNSGGKMPGAMLTFSSISSSATHGSFVVTINDVQFGGDYDGDLAGFLRYDIMTGGKIKVTTDVVAGMGGAQATFGFTVIGTTKDGRYLTHEWLGDGGAAAGAIGDAAGRLCRNSGYRGSSNLSTVSIAAGGVFPGIAAGQMSASSRGDWACFTASSTTGTHCPHHSSVPNYLCVNPRSAPISITFDMNGASNVTLADPLWYVAKYGSFTPTNKTDSNELPNLTTEWDVERNDGSACSGTTCQDGEPDGYFLGRRPELLEKRLEALLRKISSSSNAAPAVSSAQMAAGGYVYTANFSQDNRWGTVQAFKMDAAGNFPTTPTWDGSAKLGAVAASARNVITNVGASGATFDKTGLGGVTGAAYLALKTSGGTEADTDQLIDYLRGDGTNEAVPGTTGKLWRYRAKDVSQPTSSTNPRYMLGTVVNSNPWLQGPPSARQLPTFGTEPKYSTFVTAQASRQSLLWLGSNDGMLHAFSASGSNAGSPVVSYVPSPLLSRLRSISLNATNTIVAGMDGSPYTADVLVGSTPAWKTYLFSSLGRGGKAVFALDATSTTAIDANSFKWMFSSDDDADLGYVIGDVKTHPDSYQASTVARMQNGKYALLVPNGINSSNGKAFLYILFVDGPASGAWTENTHYVKLATDTQTGNGLVGVTWADTNRDGKADTIYGTDLIGRLWRFDVSSSTPSSWTVSLGGPLFEAKDGTARIPVTTAPVISFPTMGGSMIGFGTGKSIFTGDFPSSGLPQRFYGVYDKERTTAVNSNLSKMARRVAKRTSAGGVYIETAAEVTGSVKTSTFNPATHDGWYLDFPPLSTSSNVTSEMLISSPEIAVGTLFFTTLRESTSTNNCFSSPLTQLWGIDPTVGTPKVSQFGTVTVGTDIVNLAGIDGGGVQKRTMGIAIVNGQRKVVGLGNNNQGNIDKVTGSDVSPSRSQWREIPNMRTLK